MLPHMNEGYNPVFGSSCRKYTEKFTELMVALGQMPGVPEEMLEAYTVITAMVRRTSGSSWLNSSTLHRRLVYQKMLHGSFPLKRGQEIMKKSDLTPEAVMDLIPEKPLLIKKRYQEMYNDHIPGCKKNTSLPLLGNFIRFNPLRTFFPIMLIYGPHPVHYCRPRLTLHLDKS